MTRKSTGVLLALVLAIAYLVATTCATQSRETNQVSAPTLESSANAISTQTREFSASLLPTANPPTTETVPPPPAPTVSPASESTPSSAQAVAEKNAGTEDSLFDTLIIPFVNEAQKRRAERAKHDSHYYKRVDLSLIHISEPTRPY